MIKSRSTVVTPYSAVNETGENIPASRVFFPMTEQSGVSVTDVKSGVIYTPQTSIQFDNSIDAIYLEDSVAPAVQGNFPSFGTNVIVAMYAGRMSTGAVYNTRFAIGNTASATDASIGLSNLTKLHMAVQDGTNTFGLSSFPATQAALTDGMDFMILGYFQPGVECVVTAYNLANNSVVATTGSVSLAAVTMGSVTPVSKMRAQGAWCYGAAYFAFASLPSDLVTMALWTAANWKNGHKKLYPGYIGRS